MLLSYPNFQCLLIIITLNAHLFIVVPCTTHFSIERNEVISRKEKEGGFVFLF